MRVFHIGALFRFGFLVRAFAVTKTGRRSLLQRRTLAVALMFVRVAFDIIRA